VRKRQQQKLQELLGELKDLQKMIGTLYSLTTEEQGEGMAISEGRLAKVDLHLAEVTGGVNGLDILQIRACRGHQ
jgi:hypothetical protein